MNPVSLPLAEGECREFERVVEGNAVACFVVRHGGRYYGYRNRCPHRGVPLNWQPDQFLTVEQDLIQCSLHGALFRIHDGYCVHGPCVGSILEAVSWPPKAGDG